MTSPDADSSLVTKALRGDRDAFEVLVDRHLRPAFGIAFALTGSQQDSEGITQEALLRAYRALARVKGEQFGPWLGGIVRHLAVDDRRSRMRRQRADEELRLRTHQADETGPDGGAMEREEEVLLLRQELMALPEKLRLPLVLYYFEERSTERVAARLGLRPAAARKRLQLARDQLRGRLLSKLEGALARAAPRPGLERTILAALAANAVLPGGEMRAATAKIADRTVPHWVAGGTIMGMKKAIAFLAWAVLLSVGGAIFVADPMGWRSGGRDATPTPRNGSSRMPLAEAGPTVARPDSVASRTAQAVDRKDPAFGVVLDTNGEPAPEVVVTAYRLGAREGAEIEWRPKPPRVTTGAGGEFRFEALEYGPWGLVAVGRLGKHAVLPRIQAPVAAGLVLRLEDGHTDQGLVMDLEGRPLPGAEVRIDSLAAGWQPRYPMESIALRANEDGAFRLPGLPPGKYRVEARHTAFCYQYVHIAVPLGDRLEFRLKPAACFEATVHERDRSHPLRNAEVSIRNCTPTGSSGTTVETGPEGKFISSAMHPGQHTFVFQHGSFQTVTLSLDLTLLQPLRGVEVIFLDGMTVRGSVRNTAGDALPGADLYWKPRGACNAEERGCKAGDDGRFTVPGLAAGTWTVLLEGFADQDRRTAEVVLADDGPQEVDLVMDVPSPIRILVTDAGGTPLAGVAVSVELRTPRKSGGLGSDKTNALGWVTLAGAAAEGAQGVDSAVVNVVNPPASSPPIVTIKNPTNDSLLQPNTQITMRATATDPDGSATISYEWILIRANGTMKTLGTTTSANGGTTTLPWTPKNDVPSGCGSQAVKLRVKATDQDGQTGTKTIDVEVLFPPC